MVDGVDMDTVELMRATPVAEVPSERLAFSVPAEWLPFKTTAEISAPTQWIGQERALAALEMGLRVQHAGFNIYVCGLLGTHRERDLASLLQRFMADQPTPGDRVLVQNFRNRDRPRALYLPAGWGMRLRQDIRELVEELRRALPKTLREETFEEEKEKLSEQFGEQGEAINRQLAEHATQAGFALQPGPNGEVLFIPLKDGRPMEPKELAELTEAEQMDLRRRQRELGREVKAVIRQQRSLLGRLAREVKGAERRVAAEAIHPLFEDLAERYPQEEVRTYLSELREHVLDHLAEFREGGTPQPVMPPFMVPPSEDELFLDYEVNVLVDNGPGQGAPIIVEPSPTYRNLFGAVERVVDRFGKLVTNFTRVTAGSLLRAHGGCLVINVLDALSEPLVWRTLKRALKSEELEIEGYDPFALFATSMLKPEPMKIQTRVVLTGPTDVFQLLYFLDEEFPSIFKVRADFGFEAEGEEARQNFIAQIATIGREEGLPPLSAPAVARLMEFASRSVGDRRKLPSQCSDLGDLVREAAFWATKSQQAQIEVSDVEQAIEQRRFRLNRTEVKVRELIRDKVLLINLDGERVGQVNGLAVSNIGGYDFGRPARITASVSMGNAGIIAVDREAKLTGSTYDKAVFIISGYLRKTYAQDFPLSLYASLSFEQSYSGIEGDSASVAELLALVSAISGVPLRQDLAVTGSVDQFGEVQPIGGVNEKVEGFFYACQEVGLTGKQGVVLPIQNLEHLVPCREVVEAVRLGKFHIYAIQTIDEAIELFSGAAAGNTETPGTVHHLAAGRLRQLAEGLRSFSAGGVTDETTADNGNEDRRRPA